MISLLIVYISDFVYTSRFVYAHLNGKCRRRVILEYFGEDPSTASAPTSQCCDICITSPQDLVDVQKQMEIIVKATLELCAINATGEKKVHAC